MAGWLVGWLVVGWLVWLTSRVGGLTGWSVDCGRFFIVVVAVVVFGVVVVILFFSWFLDWASWFVSLVG